MKKNLDLAVGLKMSLEIKYSGLHERCAFPTPATISAFLALTFEKYHYDEKNSSHKNNRAHDDSFLQTPND